MAIPTVPIDLCPETEAGYEAARRQLRKRLAVWSTDSGANLGPDVGEELVHYKWGYFDGHLARWTRADLDAVLLELYPAKMVVDDCELDGVLLEAAAFIRFLAETGLLDPASEDPDVLYDHLEGIGPRFRQHMTDASRYSRGKRFCWPPPPGASPSTAKRQSRLSSTPLTLLPWRSESRCSALRFAPCRPGLGPAGSHPLGRRLSANRRTVGAIADRSPRLLEGPRVTG